MQVVGDGDGASRCHCSQTSLKCPTPLRRAPSRLYYFILSCKILSPGCYMIYYSFHFYGFTWQTCILQTVLDVYLFFLFLNSKQLANCRSNLATLRLTFQTGNFCGHYMPGCQRKWPMRAFSVIMIAEESSINGYGFGKFQIATAHAVTVKISMMSSQKVDVNVDVCIHFYPSFSIQTNCTSRINASFILQL